MWLGAPGGDRRYAAIDVYKWLGLGGSCTAPLPDWTGGPNPVPVDGYAVNEIIPLSTGGVAIPTCSGPPNDRVNPWGTEAPGSRGWGYYSAVMRWMAQDA